jgi:pyruvate/2-oxoglutarate dehydrogenase complex dihydrolipoamide acyltransferase (E2) component
MPHLEFRLPDIGEGLAEAEVVSWLIKPGDQVRENQPICDIETDKAIVTMPAPASGQVHELRAQPGDRVAVGAVLLVLEVSDADAATAAASKAEAAAAPAAAASPHPRSQGSASTPAAPATRKAAADLGVDLARVTGSGPGGRITVEDVRAYAARQPSAAAADDVTRVPVQGLRRRIAEAMTQSVRAIPHVCGFHELDGEALSNVYHQLKPVAAAGGVRLTYLPFLVRAVALALIEHPPLNASYDESGPAIVLKKRRNIGIATATPDGLLVPVVRDADTLDLLALARELERLGERGRARALTPQDLHDGTFTISNVGAAGGWFGTSIIRYPEAAILGVGRIAPRAVVRQGRVEVRPVLPLSLTFDHRVIDGDGALAFVETLRRLIEHADSPALTAPDLEARSRS